MPLEQAPAADAVNTLSQVTSSPDTSSSTSTPAPSQAPPTSTVTAPPPAASASDVVGLRDALAPILGNDFRSQFQDDNAALVHLANAYQQAQRASQYEPYVQQYLQHADKFNAWRTEQEAAERAKQAQSQQWWKPPEFNREWLNMVEKDAQGNLRAKPGYPMDVPAKLLAALDHQKNFLNDFSFDPMGKIKPGVEEIATRIAQEIVQKHLGGYQDNVFANNYVQQNASWIYQRDQAGNVMRDPRTGGPAFTEAGQRFGSYVAQAQNMGVSTLQGQQAYAQGMVERDLALAQIKQQGATAQGDQAKQGFLDQRNPSQAASTRPTAANGSKPIGTGTRNLEQRMLQNMEANGIQRGQKVNGR